MNLFVCSTPYHVFNAVNISKTLFVSEISDLYILNVSNTSVEIFNKIKDKNIFRRVYLINVYNNKKSTNRLFYCFNRVKKMLFTEKMIPNKEDLYHSIFIVGTEIFSKLIYYYWYKKNNQIILNYYEDGTASYFKILMEDKEMLKNKFLTTFKGFDILGKCESLYVYRPECVISRYEHIRINQIPLIQRDEKHIIKLKQILKSENKNISNKIIFFDSNFGDERILNQQIEFVNMISGTFTDISFGIKLHPNSNGNLYGKDIELIKTSDGFEMINFDQNMSDKLLVSIISSACITPKLIYDEEPHILYLYKLICGEELYPHFNSLVESVKKLYREPEKIIVPKNYDELKNFLLRVNKQSSV